MMSRRRVAEISVRVGRVSQQADGRCVSDRESGAAESDPENDARESVCTGSEQIAERGECKAAEDQASAMEIGAPTTRMRP